MNAHRVLQRFQERANRITRSRNGKKETVGFILLSVCVVTIVLIGSLVASPVRLIAYLVKRVKRLTKKDDSQPQD